MINRIIDGFIKVIKRFPGLESQFSLIDDDVIAELRGTWTTIIRKTIERKNYKNRLWRKSKMSPRGLIHPLPKSKSAMIVLNVLTDMRDRRGLRQEYDELNVKERRNFKKAWLCVVRNEIGGIV